MPRVLGGSKGGGRFLVSEVSLQTEKELEGQNPSPDGIATWVQNGLGGFQALRKEEL